MRNQNKQTQTLAQSFVEPRARKSKSPRKPRSQNRSPAEQDEGEKSFQDAGNQTQWVEEIKEESYCRDEPAIYIPIQQRVEYIIQSKEQKIKEQQQVKQAQEELFYQQFVKENDDVVTAKQAERFQHNQIKWKNEVNNKLITRRIEKNEEIYSFRPSISEKSKQLARKRGKKPGKCEHSESKLNMSFSPNISTSFTKSSLYHSNVMHTEQRMKKREQDRQAEVQNFLN